MRLLSESPADPGAKRGAAPIPRFEKVLVGGGVCALLAATLFLVYGRVCVDALLYVLQPR